MVDDLAEAFGAVAGDGRYESAERAATGWEWYTDRAVDPRPLSFPLSGSVPGRRLVDEPASRVGRVLHGFDSAGRLVLTRSFWAVDESSDEVVSYPAEDVVEIVDYDTSGTTHTPKRLTRLSGRIERWQSNHGGGESRYRYTDGWLTRIEVSYTDGGDVAEVWRIPDDGGERSGCIRRRSPRRRPHRRATTSWWPRSPIWWGTRT